MQFIDTHTHLYVEHFDEDRATAVQRATDAGITDFYIPAIDSEYTQRMYELEAEFPGKMHLMMGLHPTSVKENFKEELQHVYEQFEKRQFAAVGEIGIDLYWDTSTLDIQIEAFKAQIQFAKKLDLPIVIHCRESFDEIFAVLEEEKHDRLRGIFHCFTGTLEQAHRAIDFGMLLGIGGVATFKNGKIDKFLAEIPLEHLVLETDSPYLAPVPHRGKRNESSYLRLVSAKLADIYGVTELEIANQTTANAKRLFENS
ncbi:TatD family hydrolase [Gilvibacter sediminis]|uniref:TatD family hydrolase n=1 Tax=Gilvibacter sediminis TaxID=379071 RepID=UPI002350D888|nr:TatD family hydrolase [Gilvibacter sediminis]MDC7996485.1 TatD family hydrolase [Gilvibacter sediminis]